ncbi:MAG: sulfite exporter TauE/SafE family protein [Melioribacteraceae bacterium]|nr:sulfite exporter TauE/SafE family protein [Melioribacteraceae bacterium]
MNEIISTIIFLVIGFVTGGLSGLLGIGGGVIFVPALIFLLPFTGLEISQLTYVALATSLFAGSFSASGASYNHFRIRNLYFKEALLLALGSCSAAVILPKYVVKVYPETLKYILLVILILVAINMLLNKSDNSDSKFKIPASVLPVLGFLTGTMAVFTGLGGGVIFVPVLFYLYKMDIKKAIGTSSFVVAATMLSSSFMFSRIESDISSGFYMGYINIYVGLLLGIGALIGSFTGVKLFNKVKAIYIKKIFSVFLIIVILIILFKQ